MGVDVHSDVAVGVAHQRLHGLHILIIFGKKLEREATGVTGEGSSDCRRRVLSDEPSGNVRA
jgi:hypothetical protein